ncbi:MAG: methyltransferase domain-containing protein [Cyanobacteriota bacterium]|nr:methyltransferase domain-containing protein [Cyanobacteriota bacterium]
MRAYRTSAFLKAEGSRLYTVFGWSQRQPVPIVYASWLVILEIFVHVRDPQTAFSWFCRVRDALREQPNLSRDGLEASAALVGLVQSHATQASEILIYLSEQKLTFLPGQFKSFVDQNDLVDLIHLSYQCLAQHHYSLLLNLFYDLDLEDDLAHIDNQSLFEDLLTLLTRLGLLTPALGTIDWGDFRQTVPLCHVTGFTRGTPVDRYYLQKFVEATRTQVKGDVLEIGGVPKDRESYQFQQTHTYRILNIEPGVGVDLVGDAHEADLLPQGSLDSVIIFNVLEHCHSPWLVVHNIYNWLRVGGKCFCMVPTAQRIHARPGDYWRPLPEGLAFLFRDFTHHTLYVYGNPLTVVASFHGIASEELSQDELNEFHPDYPVCTCIVAEK